MTVRPCRRILATLALATGLLALPALAQETPKGPLGAPDPFIAWKGESLVHWNGEALKVLHEGPKASFLKAVPGAVLFVAGGELKHVDLATGAVTVVAPVKAFEGCAVVEGETVFFVDGGTVFRAELGGEKPKALKKGLLSKKRPQCVSLSYERERAVLEVEVGVPNSCFYAECQGEDPSDDNKTVSIRIKGVAPVGPAKEPPVSACPDARTVSLELVDAKTRWELVRQDGAVRQVAPVAPSGIPTPAAVAECMEEDPEGADEMSCGEPSLEGARGVTKTPWVYGLVGAGGVVVDDYVDQYPFVLDTRDGSVTWLDGEPVEAPSGCWTASGGVFRGPTAAPAALTGLEFISWL